MNNPRKSISGDTSIDCCMFIKTVLCTGFTYITVNCLHMFIWALHLYFGFCFTFSCTNAIRNHMPLSNTNNMTQEKSNSFTCCYFAPNDRWGFSQQLNWGTRASNMSLSSCICFYPGWVFLSFNPLLPIGCPEPSTSCNLMRLSRLWMRFRRMWIKFSRVVRASDHQCQSRNIPGFDPSILRDSRIWRAADEAVLNKLHTKKLTLFNFMKGIFWINIRSTKEANLFIAYCWMLDKLWHANC